MDRSLELDKDYLDAPLRMQGLDFDTVRGKTIHISGSGFISQSIENCINHINLKLDLGLSVSSDSVCDIAICVMYDEPSRDFVQISAKKYICVIGYDQTDEADELIRLLSEEAQDIIVIKTSDIYCYKYHKQIAYDISEKLDKDSGKYDSVSEIYISEFLVALVMVLVGAVEGDEFVVSGDIYASNNLKNILGTEMIPTSDAVELSLAPDAGSEGIFVFSDAMDEDFKSVQALVVAILVEIDRICRKHGIRYFLAGGTLLGAVRHRGFIPWDYDGDIMMTRDDYERFISIARDELPDGLFLQIPETDEDNHFYTKIRLDGTVFSTEFTSRFKNLHQGIFVDIFVHDATADSALFQKIHRNMTILTRSMVFNKWGDTDIRGVEQDGSHRIVRKLATLVKNIMPMSVLEKWQFSEIKRYCHRRTPKYLYDGMGQNLRRGVFPASWLDESIEWEFEGNIFPIPKEYDNYLNWLYGDYLEPIDCSKRHISHEMTEIDLGRYRGFRMGDSLNNI